MSEKTNNTFKECCDLYMKERITNSFAETIKHTWDYRQKEIDQLKQKLKKVLSTCVCRKCGGLEQKIQLIDGEPSCKECGEDLELPNYFLKTLKEIRGEDE